MNSGSGRRGLQGEVLASLALVMLTANALLAGVMLRAQAAQVDRTRALIGRGLLAEARGLGPELSPRGDLGLQWALIGAGDQTTVLDSAAEAIALARAVRKDPGAPLLRAGAPWEPILFGLQRTGSGDVVVAELAPAVSLGAVLGLIAADVGVFLAIGGYLLRRRVIGPLQTLARAARAVGEGGLHTRVEIGGVAEAAQLAGAFNDMSDALEQRTDALEKAVIDLRESNRSLRQARAGLDRAERLAAVGTLAAGVAHEVGNPMGAVLAFLDLARREVGPDGEGGALAGHLEKASREGERVRGILRQLLDFSRPPRSQARPFALLSVAEQAASLVRAQRRYAEVAIEVDCDAACPQVLADESVVVQILLNLVLNAADAVASCQDRRIRLSIRESVAQRRAGDELLPPNRQRRRHRPDAVECCVEDTGPGISGEELERVFDPFYTTKPPGEGTGLGLANARRLAQEMGGSLEVENSESLGGAALVLRLPPASSEARHSAREASSARARTRRSRGEVS